MTVLEKGIPEAISQAGVSKDDIRGLGIDFTSCTVLPVSSEGVPLCTLEQWRDRRHAWPKLWKHHAAQAVADRLTDVALEREEEFLLAVRRPDLIGVVLPEADRAVARGSRDLRRRARVHRGDRLDRLVPDGGRVPPNLHRRATRRCGLRRTACPRASSSKLPTRASRSQRRSLGPRSRRWGRARETCLPTWLSDWGCPSQSRWRSGTSTRSCRFPAPGSSIRGRS